MALTIGEERPPAGEDDTIAELVALQLALMRKSGATHRGQHAKHHGYCDATLLVHDNVPALYRQGLFATPKAYDARVRWSNGGSDDDTAPDVRGMAVKVFRVTGAGAVPGTVAEEQDFILIDSETFFASDVKTLLAFMKARAAAARAADPAIMQAFAQQNPLTVQLLQASLTKISSPFTVRYWSTVPYKLASGAVKYAIVPAADNGPGDAQPASKDYLRHTMVQRLAAGSSPVVFELSIIPQTDPEKMPLENPTVRWDSAPVPVATITVLPQVFDTPERMQECETASFDPWHALAEHAPLGGINRARRAVYAASLALRRTPSGAA